MTSPAFRDNPWRWWLEEEPQAAWGALRPQTGSRSFKEYWKGQQASVWGDYQGALGQQVLSGGAPTLNWADYLQNYNFSRGFQELSPRERGETPSRLAPRLRWNFG